MPPSSSDIPEQGIICSACAAPLAPGLRFCKACGQEAEPRCVSCRSHMPEGATQCPACGTAVVRSSADSEPSRSGTWDLILARLRSGLAAEYQVTRELGRGGQATVYHGVQRALNRQVAIKVLAPSAAADRDSVLRFRSEAKTLAGMQHPHIVKIFTIRQVGDLSCFIMQYLGARSLGDVLRTEHRLSLPVARTMWYQIGSALDYAHQRKFVHRDVKPANVLFDTDGLAVVTDFGIAKQVQERGITQTAMLLGTPRYMSPEQCMAEPVSPASDQYSFGIMAYEMVSGGAPYIGSDLAVLQQHVQGQIPALLDEWPECPPALSHAIVRMMAKDPSDRFPDMRSALTAIGATAASDREDAREMVRTVVFASEKTMGRLLTPTDRMFAINGVPIGASAEIDTLYQELPNSRPVEGANSDAMVAEGSTAPKKPEAPGNGRGRQWLLIGGGVALLVVVGLVARRLQSRDGKSVVTPTDTIAVKDSVPKLATLPPPAPMSAATVARLKGPDELNLYLDGLAVDPVRMTPVDSAGRRVPDATVRYVITDTNIATIDQEGNIALHGTGTTQLIATSGGKVREMPIKVLAVPGQTAPSSPEDELAQLLQRRAFRALRARLDRSYTLQPFNVLQAWMGDSIPAEVTCSRVGATPALTDENFGVRCQVDVGDKGRQEATVDIERRPGRAWTARFR